MVMLKPKDESFLHNKFSLGHLNSKFKKVQEESKKPEEDEQEVEENVELVDLKFMSDNQAEQVK
jgi:hypothetical protein